MISSKVGSRHSERFKLRAMCGKLGTAVNKTNSLSKTNNKQYGLSQIMAGWHKHVCGKPSFDISDDESNSGAIMATLYYFSPGILIQTHNRSGM